jgi:thymidylate synthase
MNKLDKTYTDLLQDILDNGVTKQDRTQTGTISVFGRQIRHKMSEGFPLLTTKKMPWKSIVTELLWFLQGNTNIKWLVDNGCNIWNGDAYKNYCKNVDEGTFSRKWLKLEESFDGFFTNEKYSLYTQEEFINKIKEDDEFAERWGQLGPIYGKQWRSWTKFEEYDDAFEVDILEENEDSVSLSMGTSGMVYEIDQIQNLINDLKINPDSRRLMVNAWNVGELDQMVLPPCHYGFQVYTRELSVVERMEYYGKHFMKETESKTFDELSQIDYDKLNIPTRAISLMWNQRSVDTFLGLPFNIASYGLLLEIIAKEVNMIPDELIGNLGDVHLYSNHIDQAKEQIGRKYTHEERTELLKQAMGEENYNKSVDELMPFGGGLSEYYNSYKIPNKTREPYKLPSLKFSPCPITGIDMEYQSIAQFQIENYESHPVIKAPLSN